MGGGHRHRSWRAGLVRSAEAEPEGAAGVATADTVLAAVVLALAVGTAAVFAPAEVGLDLARLSCFVEASLPEEVEPVLSQSAPSTDLGASVRN